MYVLEHNFSNFKVIQIVQFKNTEMNVLGIILFLIFDLAIIVIALFCNFLSLFK